MITVTDSFLLNFEQDNLPGASKNSMKTDAKILFIAINYIQF